MNTDLGVLAVFDLLAQAGQKVSFREMIEAVVQFGMTAQLITWIVLMMRQLLE